MLTGANQRVHDKLTRAGIVDLIGTENLYSDLGAALIACEEIAQGKA
jgi:hypothetical protein